MKIRIKQPTNSQLIVVIIFSCVALLILLFINRSNPTDNTSIIKDRKPQTVSNTAGTANSGLSIIEQGKKPSSVCEKISSDTMTVILVKTVTEAIPSIPDTKTAEGNVAGCSYAIKESEGQKIESVSIVARTLQSDEDAKKSYDVLGKADAIKLDQVGDEAYLLSGKKQVIIRKGPTIITVNIAGNSIGNPADIVRTISSKL